MQILQQQVKVLVGGKPVKMYGHEGRTFIEAKDGTEYTIKIDNNASTRIEAVTTVDGLSVIDGHAGTKTSAGYVIPAFGSYEIGGWRKSNSQVNAFKFAAKSNSYAANTEASNFSDQHCGAIGVVVFPEYVKPEPAPQWNYRPEYIPVPVPYYPRPRPRPNPWRDPYDPWNRGTTICKSTGDASGDSATFNMVKSSASSELSQSRGISAFNAPSAVYSASIAPDSVDFDLGTEFSDKVIQSNVTTTSFERANEGPTFTIYYGSRKFLESLGIQLDKETQIASRLPDPFPKDTAGYCQPPKKRS